MKFVLIFFIKCYQIFISVLFPACCRFYPSCSHYALQALRDHGCRKGIFLIIKRLLKCGWWHPGGLDLVPEKKTNSKEFLIADPDTTQRKTNDSNA